MITMNLIISNKIMQTARQAQKSHTKVSLKIDYSSQWTFSRETMLECFDRFFLNNMTNFQHFSMGPTGMDWIIWLTFVTFIALIDFVENFRFMCSSCFFGPNLNSETHCLYEATTINMHVNLLYLSH